MGGQSAWEAAQEGLERAEGRCFAWASYKWRLEREHGHEQERGSVRKKRLERTLRKKGRSRAGTT